MQSKDGLDFFLFCFGIDVGHVVIGRVFIHEDGAWIPLTFDVILVISSALKLYQIAVVEGANISFLSSAVDGGGLDGWIGASTMMR